MTQRWKSLLKKEKQNVKQMFIDAVDQEKRVGKLSLL